MSAESEIAALQRTVEELTRRIAALEAEVRPLKNIEIDGGSVAYSSTNVRITPPREPPTQ